METMCKRISFVFAAAVIGLLLTTCDLTIHSTTVGEVQWPTLIVKNEYDSTIIEVSFNPGPAGETVNIPPGKSFTIIYEKVIFTDCQVRLWIEGMGAPGYIWRNNVSVEWGKTTTLILKNEGWIDYEPPK